MTELLRNSFIGSSLSPLYERIKAAASRSFAAYLLFALMAWVGRLADGSLIKFLFTSECKTDEKWRQSAACRVVSAVANFFPWLLRKIYTRFEKTLGESRMVYYLTLIGEAAPYIICLTAIALLSIHHKQWNNMYSLLLATAALLCLWLRNIRGSGLVRFDAIGLWPLVFAFVTLASALWAPKPDESLRFAVFSVTCMLIVGVCTSAVKNERQFTLLMLSFALGIFACSAYGFYQRFVMGIPASSSFTDLSVNANMPGRVYSFFDNPNACANVLVFFTPLMLGCALYTPGKRKKAAFWLAFVLGVGTMLMTYSRGAWMAFAVGVFVMIIILRPRLIPVFAILFFIAVPMLPANILNRFFTIFGGSDSSINSRTYIYTAVYNIIKDNPLGGVGLGTTNLKYIADEYGYYNAAFPFVHAHSIYLEIWAESGILALGSFVLTMFFALKKGVRTVRSGTSPVLHGAAAGCVGGIVGSMIFGITDYAWSYPRVMALFWFLIAIVYTASRLAAESRK